MEKDIKDYRGGLFYKIDGWEEFEPFKQNLVDNGIEIRSLSGDDRKIYMYNKRVFDINIPEEEKQRRIKVLEDEKAEKRKIREEKKKARQEAKEKEKKSKIKSVVSRELSESAGGIKVSSAVEKHLTPAQRKLVDDNLNKTQMEAIFVRAQDDFTIFAMLLGHVIAPAYKLYTVHKEIAYLLQKTELEGILGLGLSMPPRGGKSKIVDLYIAWVTGREPHLNQTVITYAESLSQEHIMTVRSIVKDPVYKKIFPKAVIRRDADSKSEFITTKGGIIRGIGRGSGLSGTTVHRIYVDDIVKEINEMNSPQIKETLEGTIKNILQRRVSGTDVPQAEQTKIIVIGTRYYAEDPIGVFMHLIEKKWNGFIRNYPAIAYEPIYSDINGELLWDEGDLILPERVGKDVIDTNREIYTEDEFNAVYQGVPLEDTTHFKKEWIKYATEEEIMKENPVTFLTIDPAVSQAKSADDTGFAIGFLTRGGVVYVKAWGEKIAPTELVNKIFDLQDKYNFKVIGMEKMLYSQGFEAFFVDEMKRQNRLLRFELMSHNNKAKEVRITAALPALYNHGLFRHIKGENLKLEKQMFEFPNGKHDDVLDAVAMLADLTSGEKEKQRNFGKVIRTNFIEMTKW